MKYAIYMRLYGLRPIKTFRRYCPPKAGVTGSNPVGCANQIKKPSIAGLFYLTGVPDCRREPNVRQIAQRFGRSASDGAKPQESPKRFAANPASAQTHQLYLKPLYRLQPQAFHYLQHQQTQSPRINLRKSLALELLLALFHSDPDSPNARQYQLSAGCLLNGWRCLRRLWLVTN